MSFDQLKDRLKETYKTRKCPWCKASCKNCEPKCNCFYCKFEDNYDLVVGDYQYIKDWMMSNLKFFEKLYKEGLAEETILINKWKKRQLFTIERTGTKILDWTTDNEVVGVARMNHLPPEGYRKITPYHDFRKPKNLELNYCQLCGRDLEYNYYIKHDEKKLSICIGHECAEAFCLSEVFVQILKNHMRTIVEKEFKKLKIPLIKWLIEKIETQPPNEKKLIRHLERIKRHFRKDQSKYQIPAQGIAKLLLELEKEGFKILNNKKRVKTRVKQTNVIITKKSEELEKLTDEKSILESSEELSIPNEKNNIPYEIIRKIILNRIRKEGGVFGNAVNDFQIIPELQKLGMSIKESNDTIQHMIKEEDIIVFLPHSYKISKKLLDREP